MLRKFQKRIAEIGDKIAQGENVRHIYAHVTQGGGKSTIAAILSAKLPNYKICWIVPRDSLRTQGEEGFTSASNQARYGNRGEIRAAKNEANPSRESNGYITTYAAVVADPLLHQAELEKSDYILLLDECHHIPHPADKSAVTEEIDHEPEELAEETKQEIAYYRAVKPLVDKAKIVVYMTGSMERHKNARVAFIPYKLDSKGIYETIDTSKREGWEFVSYTRLDALTENAILPVTVKIIDGSVKWSDGKSGRITELPLLSRGSMDEHTDALNAVLYGTFADEVINTAVIEWRKYKEAYRQAKLLIIAANIELAKQYHKFLTGQGLHALIATSEDSRDARRNIKHFRGELLPVCDVLVSVAMAYEGLDVAQITHVVCLTNIRSKPWIEQSATRCNRIDYKHDGKTDGFVYVPADRRMMDIISLIDYGQLKAIRHQIGAKENLIHVGQGGERPHSEHIASKLAGSKEVVIDGSKERELRDLREKEPDATVFDAELMKIFTAQGKSVDVKRKEMVEHLLFRFAQMDSDKVQTSHEIMVNNLQIESSPATITLTDTESGLDRQIEEAIRKKAKHNPKRKVKINALLKTKFGARSTLTVNKKMEVLQWLRAG